MSKLIVFDMSTNRRQIEARLAKLSSKRTKLHDNLNILDGPIRTAKWPRAKRRKTYMVGHVLQADGSRLNCVLRNISEHGAHLVLEGAIALSKNITLVMPSHGMQKLCETVYQDHTNIGVKFYAT